MKLYDERETELGDELMRALERFLLLQIIDQRWREHLYDMDYLREGIHLRGFAQIDPLVAYKNEGFGLFEDLMNSIWSDFARMVYNVQVEVEARERRRRAARPAGRAATGDGDAQLLRRHDGRPAERLRRRPTRRRPAGRAPWSSSGASRSTSSSGATTRAGAARARSTRSATAPERGSLRPWSATAFRTCPFCEATCGLAVTVRGDEVVRVRGDADDVFSPRLPVPEGRRAEGPARGPRPPAHAARARRRRRAAAGELGRGARRRRRAPRAAARGARARRGRPSTSAIPPRTGSRPCSTAARSSRRSGRAACSPRARSTSAPRRSPRR